MPEVIRIEDPGWWRKIKRGGFQWVSEEILDSHTTSAYKRFSNIKKRGKHTHIN